MMRDRTPYTNEELIAMADQCEEFCPRRAATFRELAGLRERPIMPADAVNDMIYYGAGYAVIDAHGVRRLPPQAITLHGDNNDQD
ncbi:hypothetical protein PTR50_01130 [Serratia nevei]|uniref:hypothetical protein n=1 Tax=Serratia nevei TaxID=2703794 RepID=UPI00313E58B9